MASAGRRVGLVFGGRSVEHRVSILSARTVASGLEEAGHQVVPLGLGRDGSWADRETSRTALAGGLDAIAPTGVALPRALGGWSEAEVEVLFPIVHGTWGEDGSLQGFFEILGLPYVGAGVTASALAMDKVLAKRQLAAVGVPVVESVSFTAQRFASEREQCLREAERLPLPLFVKPSVGGSSVGVRKVSDRGQLASAVEFALRFDSTVLVERGIGGRELECAVLGLDPLEASVVGEIIAGQEFYDYEDKYLEEGAQLIAPAALEESLHSEIRQLAIQAFAAIGGWGMARVDFLLEGASGLNPGQLYVNEINTLPGFTDISMYPRLWALSGMPLPELVDRLVQIAIERHQGQQRLDEGIARFLERMEG